MSLTSNFSSCSSIFSASIIDFAQVKSQLASKKTCDIALWLFMKMLDLL